MGWLRDRFSRTYAYHYHKKAAQRAVKKRNNNNNNNNDNKNNNIDSAATAPFVPHDGVYEYERQMTLANGDERTFQTRLHLAFQKCNAAQPGGGGGGGSRGWNVTGKGVEVCANDNDDDDNDDNTHGTPQHLHLIQGRVAATTGKFWWVEERAKRERHLVVGTMQHSFWDKDTVIVEDGYYVKRFDVDKCGVPADGDIRESILSFVSTKQQQQQQQGLESTTTTAKEGTVPVPESAQPFKNDNQEIGKEEEDTLKSSSGETTEAKSKSDNEQDNKDTTSVATNTKNDKEPAPQDTGNETTEKVAPQPAISADKRPTAEPTDKVEEHNDEHHCHNDDDNDDKVVNDVVDALATTADPSDHDNDCDAASNLIASLLPTIREARGLINEILAKTDASKHKITTFMEKSLPTKVTQTPLTNDSHDLPSSSMVEAFTVDQSIFEEDEEDQYFVTKLRDKKKAQTPRKAGQLVASLHTLDESAHRDSQHDDDDNDDNDDAIEVVLSEENLFEEKEELHTEVERLNKTFELLSNQHHEKYKVGRGT